MLSERDRQVLDFEERLWQLDATKQSGIRIQLGMSVTRYSQILRRLVDDPEALRYAPMVTRRLRKRRDEHQVRYRSDIVLGRRQ
ncbi:hypothetical protein BMS3Bbin02_02342 [bacterium BMS3Bbin02]|nr:hypothetical protein BMS3Bbin02_02342 [bacterium BMS3Bbin02]